MPRMIEEIRYCQNYYVSPVYANDTGRNREFYYSFVKILKINRDN